MAISIKKMFTKTYEGITLQPIYTPALHQEKIPKGVYPGAGEFLRGTKASGYIKDSWGVSQYVDESLPKDANHASFIRNCERWNHSQHSS